jgi:hypothetical protein
MNIEMINIPFIRVSFRVRTGKVIKKNISKASGLRVENIQAVN